jgi:MFS family permease
VTTAAHPANGAAGGLAVLGNRSFTLLWLSQVATQIGSNMVLYGLVIIVRNETSSNSAVSALFLTFLVPAVLLSAVAGVFVDRVDRRLILVVTNVLRAAAFAAIFLVVKVRLEPELPTILALTIFASIVTVFFAPAEAAMIPFLVPKNHLVSANGLFTLTLNGAFALGFALLGPLIVTLFGPDELILIVAALYLVAALFCATLPRAPAVEVGDALSHTAVVAGRAVTGTFSQLKEGIDYIRGHRTISWSLYYLGIAASLVGVIGVLGPSFAKATLGLDAKDLVVVVLPLGLGIVTGILFLNSYGKYIPRRRAIEGGLIGLGILLALLTIAGPVSRFLQQAAPVTGISELQSLTSLLTVVVVIAYLAGIAYGIVAISSQTQLSESLPEEVRGRVFGVLNMLVSVASFLPIIVVGPISDLVSTTTVILIVAGLVLFSGIASIVRRGPLAPADRQARAGTRLPGRAMDPIGVAMRTHTDLAGSTDGAGQGRGPRDDAVQSGDAPGGRSRRSR